MEVAKEPLDVLAVGETLVDFISVEQTDWLRNATTFRRYLGGSPANIAVNVARLGGRSAVASKTGIGAFAQFVKSELQRHGVSIEYLVMDHRNRTTVAFVSSTSGKPDFEIARSGDYQLRPEEIPAEAVERAKIVHASAFALSRDPCRSAVRKVFEMAREQGKIVSLDPNYSARIWPHHKEARQILREIYQYVNITKPSADDARRIFGPEHTAEQYIELFHEMGPETVVFTMGSEGVLISEKGGIVSHVPARPIVAEDATGAGDAFWAGFLVALLDGEPPERCVYFAREIAELKLKRTGPLPLEMDREELYEKAREAFAEATTKREESRTGDASRAR
ncbi:MAG: sugar kinase [Actinomycetota bacterium]|nr:sugar kinase [Actinomycetota bacterium]